MKKVKLFLSEFQILIYLNYFYSRMMIKTITKNFLRSPLTFSLLYRNSQQSKEEILKTYLEIIPPYRIQNIVNHEKITLQPYLQISKQRLFTQEELTKIQKIIKKNVMIMPLQNLTLLLEHLNSEQSIDHYKAIGSTRKIYGKILACFQKKIDVLPLELMVNFVYKLAKMNKKQFQIMKQLQTVILQQKIKVNYLLIKRILWTYTHLDVGSTVLYAHISKTIRIGQHEFAPLELAEFAYMLSKVSENAKGGFGIFTIAEKHVEAHLSRLNFHSLVKASFYILSQNLGSNEFQLKLEEQLYKKYPSKDSLKINDLVMLLKSTSLYYFKFNESALLHMLRSSTERLTPESSIEQFEDIIWSWGRARKGDEDMWRVIQNQTCKFIEILKPRQIAFFYYSLCCSQFSKRQTLQKLEKKFLSLDIEKISQHYLLKFLLGMEKRKDFDEEIFSKISGQICKKIEKLSNRELLMFVKILNESDIDYENKEKFKLIIENLSSITPQIQKKIFMFKVHELAEILYLWIKLDLQIHSFRNKLFSMLENVINIPKPVFIKALFSFTMCDQHQKMFQMLPILEELLKYGPIGYFFSPYELPLMAYCVFHAEVNGKGNMSLNPELLKQLSFYMKQINPEILNKFVNKAYVQTLKLMERYEKMRKN